jgi:hypothetical protein
MNVLIKISVTLLVVFLFFSCKKDEMADLQNEEILSQNLNSKWTFDGKSYSGKNPSWGIPCGGSIFMFAQTTIGDTTVFCDITMPSYMPLGKFRLYTHPPYGGGGVILKLVKQVGNTYYENHVSTYGYADSIECKDNGEFYMVSCNNISMLENYNPYKIKKFSCDIKFKKPTIPVENSSYTFPVGVPENQFYVNNILKGGPGCRSYTITNYGCYFKADIGNVGSITCNFSESLPPSGTYDIIPDFNLKPGKVFIQFVNPDPLSSYISASGGKATVITTQNKFIIKIDSTKFTRIGSQGNPEIFVNGSAGFY